MNRGSKIVAALSFLVALFVLSVQSQTSVEELMSSGNGLLSNGAFTEAITAAASSGSTGIFAAKGSVPALPGAQ